MSYDYRILYDSPVGAWTFNTSAASMTDITGNAHDAVTNPRANILSNPSLETNTSGWTTLDLAMGSIARDSPATPFVTNIVSNPNAATNTTGVSYPNSTSDSTTSRVTGSGCPVSDTAFQFSQPANGARTYDYISFTIGTKPAAGDTVAISYWVRSTDASVTSISTSIADGNGLNVNWSTSFDTVTTSWTKIVKVATFGTSTSTSNVLYIVPNHGGTTSAKALQITGVQIQSYPVNSPFIPQSGTSSLKAVTGAFVRQTTEEKTRYTASAYVYPPVTGAYGIYQVGGPVPSTEYGPGRRYSIAKNGPGVLAEDATVNLLGNSAYEIDGGFFSSGPCSFAYDTTRFMLGTRSVRVTGTASASDQYIETRTQTMNQVWLQANTTYTASVYYYTAATSGKIKFSIYYTSPYGATLVNLVTATLVTGAWTRITSTFTTGSTSGYASFLPRPVKNSADTSYTVDPVWYDCVQFEQRSYATSFVEGSMGTGYAYDSTTNLTSNPSLETNTTNWAARWYGAGGGAGTTTRETTGGYSGSAFYRKTWTVAPGATTYSQDTGFSYSQAATPGTVYTCSMFLRSNIAQIHTPFVEFRDSGNNLLSTIGVNSQNLVSNTANNWVRCVIANVTAPANTAVMTFVAGPYQGAITNWSVGDTLDADAVQIEARSYPTTFVTGTVAGSAGSTSNRAIGGMNYNNLISVPGSAGLSFAGTMVVGPLGTSGMLGAVKNTTERFSFEVASNGALALYQSISGTGFNGGAGTGAATVATGDVLAVIGTIDSSGTMTLRYSKNGGAMVSVSAAKTAFSTTLTSVDLCDYNGSYAPNGPVENFMVFNTVLDATTSAALLAALYGGTVSTYAARNDCVFSAFINDGPVQTTSLTGGTWTRISSTKDTVADQKQTDVVIIGPSNYLATFVDAVQLEKANSASAYTETTNLVLSTVDMPIVARGINALRLVDGDSITFPVTEVFSSNTPRRSFSLECWFKPQSATDFGWLFKRNEGGLRFSGNTLSFTLPMANTIEAKWEGAVIGNNYHVVAVYDTNAAYLYVNKELVATAQLTAADLAFGFPSETASDLTMSASGAFSMVVDFPAVYNYALTQRDVSAHYAYGTNHPYSVDTSSAFPSNTFEINDARATIKYLYEANTTQVWDAGIITGGLSVVSDTLQSNYDSNGSAYGAGTWIGSFTVPAEATTTVGSRISWVASRYTGYTVSVSTDGTTFTPVTNFSQPFGALNLVAGQTLYVKIAVDAGITATVFSDLRVAIYGTKAVAAANNNVIALTLSNEVAMTLGENTVNPATFCDNTGYGLVGTTSKLSIAQDATFGGYQATEFYAKWAANTPSSTFFYTAENTSAVTVDSAGQFVVKPGYLMYVDGQLLYNFAPDPSFESNTFSPVFQGNGTTVTRQSATVRTGSYAWQVVTPGTGSNEGIQNMGVTPAGAISAGDVVTVTIYARGTGNVQLEARCGNSGNTFIQSFFSTSTALSAGAWTRLSVTFTAPANSSVLSAKVNTPTTQAITFYVDDLQFEKSATASAFMIPAPTVNRWHHVVITHPATTAGANIGNSSANNAGFPMQIGYLAAHFNALTQANVTSLYTSIAGYAANRVIDTSVIGLVELNFPSTTKPYQLYSYDWSISSGG